MLLCQAPPAISAPVRTDGAAKSLTMSDGGPDGVCKTIAHIIETYKHSSSGTAPLGSSAGELVASAVGAWTFIS